MSTQPHQRTSLFSDSAGPGALHRCFGMRRLAKHQTFTDHLVQGARARRQWADLIGFVKSLVFLVVLFMCLERSRFVLFLVFEFCFVFLVFCGISFGEIPSFFFGFWVPFRFFGDSVHVFGDVL